MPAPGLTYVTVSDVLYRGDGSFDHGVLEFRIPFPIRRAGVVLLTTTTFTVTIHTTDNGAFTVSLPASDDVSNNPAQWLYEVQARTAEWNQAFYLNVPIAKAGTGAKLSELLPATPAQAAFDLSSFLPKTGGTMTGPLILSRDPQSGLEAATQQFVLAQSSAGVPDATSSVKGKLQLAGDLAGSAAAPTVPGLSGKAPTNHTHVESDTTNLVADLAAKVAKSTVTTKGDLLAATASATISRLGVGSDGQYLQADSSQSAGLKWNTVTGGSGGPLIPEPGYYGLQSYTGDPMFVQNPQGWSSNTVAYAAVPVVAGQVITNLWVAVAVAGTWDSSTTGNQLGLYSFAGVQLGATAETPSLWTSAGWRGAAMAGAFTYTVPSSGYLYIAGIPRGITNLQLAFPAAPNDSHAPFVSLGPSQTKARAGYAIAAALPANFDPTAYGTKSGYMFLAGVN